MEQWSHILPWTIFSSHLCIYFLGKKRKSVIVWADIFLPIYVFLLAEKQSSDNKQFYKSLYLANRKQKPVIIFCFLTCNVECESLYTHIKQVGVTKSFNGGLVCLIIVVVVVIYKQHDSFLQLLIGLSVIELGGGNRGVDATLADNACAEWEQWGAGTLEEPDHGEVPILCSFLIARIWKVELSIEKISV